MYKKLLFITICASLAACHTNRERYDNIMQTCVSTAMAESHHSESDVREVCHCATMKVLKKPKGSIATDAEITEIVDACIDEYIEKRIK